MVTHSARVDGKLTSDDMCGDRPGYSRIENWLSLWSGSTCTVYFVGLCWEITVRSSFWYKTSLSTYSFILRAYNSVARNEQWSKSNIDFELLTPCLDEAVFLTQSDYLSLRDKTGELSFQILVYHNLESLYIPVALLSFPIYTNSASSAQSIVLM